MIQDTLEKIKKTLYQRSVAEERKLKFLFDKMEADIELYNKNYEKATLILENALQWHAVTVNDTLRSLSMLKTAFIKMRNFNRAFEIQYLIENNWKRKSDTMAIDFGMSRSSLYAMMGLKDEAISARRREFNELDNKHDTDAVVRFYNDMGVLYNKKKKVRQRRGILYKSTPSFRS